jgi:hypothetical protein
MKRICSILLVPLFGCGGSTPASTTQRAATAAAAAAETFYSARPDLRDCDAPACGGLFLSALNQTTTLCADGVSRSECYVAEVDIGGKPDRRFVDGGVIFKGKIAKKTFPTFGNLGAVNVSQVFQPGDDGGAEAVSNGVFYTLRPDTRRCVSPICGGQFLSAINLATTVCADGSSRAECYAAELDAQVPRGALVEATLSEKAFGSFGKLGDAHVVRVFLPVDLKDGCAGRHLPECTPCTGEEKMGEACTPGAQCSNSIGDGFVCENKVWERTVHAPLGGPGTCNAVCRAPLAGDGQSCGSANGLSCAPGLTCCPTCCGAPPPPGVPFNPRPVCMAVTSCPPIP